MEKIKPKGIYGTLKKISGTRYFEVVEPFYWLLDYDDKDGYVIIAEKGLKTNFGSIPRLMWWIFDPNKYNSYVLHDSAYTSKMKYSIKGNFYDLLSRKEADLMLLEGLKYEGASRLERWCIYLGVRIGGWVAWI